MSATLDRIVTTLGCIGAAIAPAASGAVLTTATGAAATALPAIAGILSAKTIWDAVREGRREDFDAHIADGIVAVQASLPYEEATSRYKGDRAAIEQAVADILPKTIPKDEAAIRALVVENDLNGQKLATTLAAQIPAHDPKGIFADPQSKAFFEDVVAAIWNTLRSHIDERVLAGLATIDRKLDTIHDDIYEIREGQKAQIERVRVELSQKTRELGLKDGLLIGVARRYLEDDPEDFDAALRGIEAALQAAADMRALDVLPSNTGDAIDAVLARVQALNDKGRVDEATDALESELAATDAAKARLLDRAVSQARLTNTPDKAATHLLARLAFDTPEQSFEALRALWMEWWERGRDRGIAFDLEVAIALAHESLRTALNPNERGAALNDLGAALHTLGQRETGTDRLEQAVTAHTDALLERTRDRVPYYWGKQDIALEIVCACSQSGRKMPWSPQEASMH